MADEDIIEQLQKIKKYLGWILFFIVLWIGGRILNTMFYMAEYAAKGGLI